MNNDKIILISFYGDVGYAFNLPEVLAYPKNISYSRPFRYQERWISDDLLNDLKNKIMDFRDYNAALCMKLDKGETTIPIWEIQVNYIEEKENHYFFYFKTVRLINHTKNKNIEDYSNLFKITDKLAEYIDINMYKSLILEDDENIWIDFIEKIVTSENTSLKNFKKTLFYRITKISQIKRKEVVDLEPDYFENKRIWAYQFLPRKNYEIEILHKIFLDSENERLREFYNINLNGPFQANISDLTSEINSNYSTHKFNIHTINEKYVGKTISFESKDLMKYYNKNDPNITFDINFRRVKIPAYLKYDKFSIFVNLWLPYIGFFIGLLLLTLAIQVDSIALSLFLSLFGGFIQTISLVNLPKRK